MTSVPLDLVQIAWLLFGLVIGAVQIIAAVLLLRDRGTGPWLMLAGAVISLLSSIGGRLFVMFAVRRLSAPEIPVIYQIISGIGGLGTILFTAGLLIFVLQRRALRTRIDELEHIADPGR